jgi:hypothetical protein
MSEKNSSKRSARWLSGTGNVYALPLPNASCRSRSVPASPRGAIFTSEAIAAIQEVASGLFGGFLSAEDHR